MQAPTPAAPHQSNQGSKAAIVDFSPQPTTRSQLVGVNPAPAMPNQTPSLGRSLPASSTYHGDKSTASNVGALSQPLGIVGTQLQVPPVQMMATLRPEDAKKLHRMRAEHLSTRPSHRHNHVALSAQNAQRKIKIEAWFRVRQILCLCMTITSF